MKSLIKRIHNVARLRWALLGFLLALGAPALVLVYYSLSELKWEAFHQQRTLAIELSDRINFELNHWIEIEEQRAYSDYQFLIVSGDPAANYLQLSPLSSLKVSESLPGNLGFFQVDAEGQFSSPILPSTYLDATQYGIPADEYRTREKVREQILQILLDNQVLQTQVPPQQSPQQSSERVAQASPFRVANVNPQTGLSEESSIAAPPNSNPLSDLRRDSALNDASPIPRSGQKFDVQFENKAKNRSKTNSVNRLSSDKNDFTKEPSISTNELREQKLLTELNIDNKLQESISKKGPARVFRAPAEYSRSARKEQSVVPEIKEQENNNFQDVSGGIGLSAASISMFESEIDPFEFDPLNSGHWVFFRKVWRESERTIQGVIVDQEAFLQRVIGQHYRDTVLSSVADLVVAYGGREMSIFPGAGDSSEYSSRQDLGSELLFQTRLVAPFNEIELLFSINQLPDGPGAVVVRWSAIVMALVLAIGTWLLYRLGLRQMRLAQQQQDFVSAVSHELKTPLTSIRMYGEMLREGWADESKKRQYYDYIYDESERLSRLITNVLQLARMDRRELNLSIKTVCLAELLDNLRSKLNNQIERSGFEFRLNCSLDRNAIYVQVDIDAFIQVFINLVDNALKFASKSQDKVIELKIVQAGNQGLSFALRDYGPGIDKHHRGKIFDLFYRAENELTRETVGTGIGLALVNQLVRSMGGRVEVLNREPGAEFIVTLQAGSYT